MMKLRTAVLACVLALVVGFGASDLLASRALTKERANTALALELVSAYKGRLEQVTRQMQSTLQQHRLTLTATEQLRQQAERSQVKRKVILADARAVSVPKAVPDTCQPWAEKLKLMEGLAIVDEDLIGTLTADRDSLRNDNSRMAEALTEASRVLADSTGALTKANATLRDQIASGGRASGGRTGGLLSRLRPKPSVGLELASYNLATKHLAVVEPRVSLTIGWQL